MIIKEDWMNTLTYCAKYGFFMVNLYEINILRSREQPFSFK